MTIMLLLLKVAFLVAAILHSGAAMIYQNITCYDCSSDGSETDVNGCGRLAYNNVSSPTCDYCETRISTGGSSFSRTCKEGAAGTFTVGCTTGTGPNPTTTCICASGNCNNKPIYWRGSLTCFDCISTQYMDNGCGQNFDRNSPYVKKVDYCLACGLSISSSQDGGIYTRTCINTLESQTTCATTTPGNGACSLRCTTDLCNDNTNTFNGATKLAHSSASVIFYSAVALVLLAIKNAA